MKTLTTKTDLTLKDGTIIPQGSKLSFVRHGDTQSVGIFSFNGRELRMRYRSILTPPSFRSLEKWSNDGVCKSVFGARVEPDGYGPNGEPSWLMVMEIL